MYWFICLSIDLSDYIKLLYVEVRYVSDENLKGFNVCIMGIIIVIFVLFCTKNPEHLDTSVAVWLPTYLIIFHIVFKNAHLSVWSA